MIDTVSEAILRLQNHDIAGLEILVNTYQKEAVNLATLISLDQNLAEDAVIDSFLVVYRKISTFDNRRNFRPWFLKIVANNTLKAMRIRTHQITWDDFPEAENWLERLNIIDDSLVDPRTQVEQAETRQAIRVALEALTNKQRAVIYLRFYCDLSERDMAGMLKIPGGTVKSRLSAALRKLRQKFLENTEPEGFEILQKGKGEK
jgi:RNA polymerase sigma-70 factor, ECF subfamily